MIVYVFYRLDGWYPLQLENDEVAIANALNNPGTTKVERDGRIVWHHDHLN